ncbi:hypothetical protein C5748_16510 [Phyllobacterium phragmitis]|uniref:AtuA-like ferredoxin-fold domain-containing protein n=1 Tax=Phyllobacterium phragmitis TaxID=2670329 RepID=A0A2S9IPD5_9HYPH|nr:hypothetical protein [Phyllobacterium phragmitis]PRD42389.1 hypothetical protein C5748_16510 [Phyllobacterium phragmitis]
MRLRELAHSRTGDKGDTSNISVIAYRAEDWPLIRETVTVAKVTALFGPQIAGEVTRYELPQLCALNFVLKGALRGGVTRSLALDAHGKCLGSAILEMEVSAHDGGTGAGH